MDQRRERRFSTDQPVAVTVLGDCETRHTATVKNASSRGMALEMTAPVAPGTALKIEFEDAVVLGEAVFCRSGPDSHLVGVELDQVLCGLAELSRRLREFAGEEGSGSEVSYALNHRNGQNGEQSQK